MVFTLPEIIKEALGLELPLSPIPIKGVAQDTRRVQEGFIFIARRGGMTDGHKFVEGALERGAVAIVGEASEAELGAFPWHGQVPYVRVPHAQEAIAKLAATFYGQPSSSLFTLGVTGTDGKTTTSYLLHHLLNEKHPTGLMSTAGIRVKDKALTLEGHFTTPEAPEVQSLLATFRDEGCTHAVIESSSHGFTQRRLDEISYNVGIWTNLTPEHLDFHGTFENYRDAKATLMRRANLSILNADDPSYMHFALESQEVISYGILDDDTHWNASDIEEEAAALRFKVSVDIEGNSTEAHALLPMIGSYNVQNALAALAAAHASGLDLHYLLERLSTFEGVPGRMQIVQRKPFAVVVDFAHTAPALEKALLAIRPQVRGKLIVVIGAAGERDPGKRAPIGEAAVKHADIALFTEEDSRSESIHNILQTIAEGAKGAGGREGSSYHLIPDRRDAIREAVSMAQPSDLVILCGKGHEATLERADETLSWDEVAEVKGALEGA